MVHDAHYKTQSSFVAQPARHPELHLTIIYETNNFIVLHEPKSASIAMREPGRRTLPSPKRNLEVALFGSDPWIQVMKEFA